MSTTADWKSSSPGSAPLAQRPITARSTEPRIMSAAASGSGTERLPSRLPSARSARIGAAMRRRGDVPASGWRRWRSGGGERPDRRSCRGWRGGSRDRAPPPTDGPDHGALVGLDHDHVQIVRTEGLGDFLLLVVARHRAWTAGVERMRTRAADGRRRTRVPRARSCRHGSTTRVAAAPWMCWPTGVSCGRMCGSQRRRTPGPVAAVPRPESTLRRSRGCRRSTSPSPRSRGAAPH